MALKVARIRVTVESQHCLTHSPLKEQATIYEDDPSHIPSTPASDRWGHCGGHPGWSDDVYCFRCDTA